jgi:magnesium-transporting ATPase (P-type)
LDEELTVLKSKLKKRKLELHYILKSTYKRWFTYMDVLMIFAIIFNIGALITTNILVVKQTPSTPFYEIMPVAAETNNYQLHEDWKNEYTAFMFNLLIYVILLSSYWVFRHNIYSREQLISFCGSINILFFIFAIDFLGNFSYLIGKLIYT